MVITNTFRVDQGNREIVPLTSQGFPYVCIDTELDFYRDRTIGWHWHTAYEIAYVTGGEAQIKTPNQEIALHKGDAVFMNSGVLHAYKALEPKAKEIAQIFDMHLLSGAYNSVFEEKYFLPVNRSSALEAWVIRPDSLRHLKMIQHVLNAIELARDEPEGFELDLRSELSHFWLLLLKDTEELRASSPHRKNTDSERLKLMMDYIQDHYGEKLTLNDIAASANISSRECTRCFQRCIEVSPIIYLNAYRLRKAGQMLIESNDSILSISESCGFSSPSYFGKMFRDAMGCTPAEYRKQA